MGHRGVRGPQAVTQLFGYACTRAHEMNLMRYEVTWSLLSTNTVVSLFWRVDRFECG